MFNSGEYISNNNKDKIKDILQSNGYNVKDCGNYIQFPALWRNGDDSTSVTCYPDSGRVIDWVTSEKFDIKELFCRVLNLKSDNEINDAIKNSNIIINNHRETDIKQKKTFDESLLLYIQPDHSYPISRGVSEHTCKLFEGGAVGEVKGKLKHRYTWPIKNSKGEIIGFSGRTLNDSKIKYQHFGNKTEWIWPAFLNNKIIAKCRSVILVESNMDILYLWDKGIKNVICLFGSDLSLPILNYLLRRNVDKIIISTNNELDSPNGGVGNEAAIKIKKKLSKYFDAHNCIIKLPFKKDFCDMSTEEINKWKEELILQIGDKYFNYD